MKDLGIEKQKISEYPGREVIFLRKSREKYGYNSNLRKTRD